MEYSITLEYRQPATLKGSMQFKTKSEIRDANFRYIIRLESGIESGQSDKHDSVVKCYCSFHCSVVLMAVQMMFSFLSDCA